MKRLMQALGAVIICCSFLMSCSKDTLVVYQINEQTVGPTGANKNNLKNTIEFASIAYYDLFGTNISNTYLNKIITTYEAFGDKKLIEDLIIRNFLDRPGVVLPSDASMRADVQDFINQTYRKLYTRNASEFEIWFWKNEISNDPTLTVELIYYTLMTANEYRYY